ncbi:MAG: porin, partial [Litorimonas sp.]
PPTLTGCASIDVAGVPTAVRGHTSQFYTAGPDVADDTRIALESAHLFLRSAYGDVTVGRDDGSAFLFSLGAPTLLNVGASNSPVDYTGLDAVKTVNDASGFSEKITYTSPRLLGDRVGVGVQFGLSYALDAESCGVDYCVDLDDVSGVLAPDVEEVIEAGLALDRTFDSGLSVEGTLTYARGSERSGLAGFDDLESYGAGIEVSLSDWTVGGSWLGSNQGLADGDYQAYDIGLTWQPSQLGFTLGYGHAEDDLVGLTSDQFTGGVSWDWSERVRLGAGVQYVDRTSLRDVGGTAQVGGEDAAAVFVEAGVTF